MEARSFTGCNVNTLYIDHNPKRAVMLGLRGRGVDVLDTHEERAGAMDDEALFERVQSLGRVFFTHDPDFLRISARWLRDGREHLGVIYVGQTRMSEGDLIDQLEFIAKTYTAEELRNRVTFLPI
jgi:Domain of unknown function (DUF5615)